MYFFTVLNMIFGRTNFRDRKFCLNLLPQNQICLDINHVFLEWLPPKRQPPEHTCLDLFHTATQYNLQLDFLDLLIVSKILHLNHQSGNRWGK